MLRAALVLTVISLLFVFPSALAAQTTTGPPANLRIDLGGEGQSFSVPIQILLLLTLLTFIPAILISLTSFTRIIIVFHFLRTALGTNETPSNQIVVGLTLFLTFFIMSPVAQQINTDAIQPMIAGTISQSEALAKATTPI